MTEGLEFSDCMRGRKMIHYDRTKAATTGKIFLREKILNLLRGQKEEERFRKSRGILKKLFAMREFKQARTILFYASFDGEVETFEMMKQAQRLGKKVALPAILKDQKKIVPALIENLDDDLQAGPYGIKEPNDVCLRFVELEQIDLIIVPGIALDKNKNRLGRGKGYYDRFLSAVPATIPAFGLAFDFQIVDCLPHQEKHDVKVSRVIVN